MVPERFHTIFPPSSGSAQRHFLIWSLITPFYLMFGQRLVVVKVVRPDQALAHSSVRWSIGQSGLFINIFRADCT